MYRIYNSIHNLVPGSILIAILLFFVTTDLRAYETTILIADNDWPPWFFAGKSGEGSGFGKEVIARCVAKTGYQVKFEHQPIARMMKNMQTGELDAAIFSYRPKREEYLIYTGQPLFRESYVPFVRADSEIKIREISDFDTLKLGHLNGLTYSKEFLAYIESRRSNGTLDLTITTKANLVKLVAERIDIFVDTLSSVNWQAMQIGHGDDIKSLNFIIRSGEYYLTLSKRSDSISKKKAFIQTFNQCTQELMKSGEFSAIARRYGLGLNDITQLPE